MDKFLNEFRDKVNKAREPDFIQSDWENFISYKKTVLSKQQTTGNAILARYVDFASLAISLILIFIFSWFIFFNYSPNSYKTSDTSKSRNTENKNILIPEDPAFEDKTSTELLADIEAQNNLDLQRKDLDQEQNQKNNFQITKPQTDSGNSMQIINIDSNTNEIAEKSAFAKDQKSIITTPEKISSDISNSHNRSDFSTIELYGSLEDIEINYSEKLSLIKNNTAYYLPASKLYIQYDRFPALQPVFTEMIIPEQIHAAHHRIQIYGGATFTKAINDRIGASSINGSKLGINYFITDRFRIGLFYANSSYTKTIDSKDKDKYTVLAEIKPRAEGEILEELTVNASLRRTGIGLYYTIYQTGRFSNSLGLDFQRDISSNFAFRLRVRDGNGRQQFQNQKHNIINKSRYFISPNYYAEYRILNNASIFGKLQYDFSLSEFNEKYLNFDLGAAVQF